MAQAAWMWVIAKLNQVVYERAKASNRVSFSRCEMDIQTLRLMQRRYNSKWINHSWSWTVKWSTIIKRPRPPPTSTSIITIINIIIKTTIRPPVEVTRSTTGAVGASLTNSTITSSRWTTMPQSITRWCQVPSTQGIRQWMHWTIKVRIGAAVLASVITSRIASSLPRTTLQLSSNTYKCSSHERLSSSQT